MLHDDTEIDPASTGNHVSNQRSSDGPTTNTRANTGTSSTSRARTSSTSQASPNTAFSILAIPRPLKVLFDQFPLRIYTANILPQRSEHVLRTSFDEASTHVLYIFTSPTDAATGLPSYNPGCLKWQTILKFHGLRFRTQPSTNHAAPGGALPFLLPGPLPSTSSKTTPHGPTHASAALSTPRQVIPASKLNSWLSTQSPANSRPQPKPHHQSHHPPSGHRRRPLSSTLSRIYPSLLTPLRHAYLHALYLDRRTFTSLAAPLYIHPCSRSAIVRHALAGPLRDAALEQLVLGAPGMGGGGVGVRIDVEAVYVAAEEALEALSTNLGKSNWFGGDDDHGDGEDNDSDAAEDHGRTQHPGTLDAAVFAYTHVILEYFAGQEEGSHARRLLTAVQARKNLVDHRERILDEYYSH